MWDSKRIRRIRCFGDSITAGWGVLPGKGWIAVLAGRMKQISFCNYGMPGAGLSSVFRAAKAQEPVFAEGDGLFFMGGTNDILCGTRLAAVEALFEREIRRYAARYPVTVGIPPLATEQSICTGWQSDFAFEANQRDLAAYGDFIRELGETLLLPILDCREVLTEDSLYGDGIHPSEAGYRALAEKAQTLWDPGR